MKRKIAIALGIFFLFFFISGIYAITVKEKACSKLDNLVRLHRIEILRGHLLIHLKWVQSDLQLRNTRHARSMDTITEHITVLQSIVPSCFACHHTEPVTGKIEGLRDNINEYQAALQQVMLAPYGDAALKTSEDRALQIGVRLISELDELTTLTSRKLNERTDRAFQEITRTNTMLYVLLGIVPVAALVFAFLFIRGFTQPVNKLLTATRRLKSGDLNHRIEGLRDEYAEVAASFNEMADSLEAHLTRMQWAEQLVLLGEISGGLAHDGKNALAGIKLSMKVLSRDTSLSSENREVLSKVVEQIQRLEGLLKTLLDVAKPPNQKLLPLQMNTILDIAIDVISKHPSFLTRSRQKSIVIEKTYDPRLPAITADPFHLQQIFMNLLVNAAEAMPDGGRILVRTVGDPVKPSITVVIADTGTGIDEAVREDIFRPFFTTKPEGTGLGLAICRRLVEKYGGEIHAENASGGASFTVRMPLIWDSAQNEGGTDAEMRQAAAAAFVQGLDEKTGKGEEHEKPAAYPLD